MCARPAPGSFGWRSERANRRPFESTIDRKVTFATCCCALLTLQSPLLCLLNRRRNQTATGRAASESTPFDALPDKTQRTSVPFVTNAACGSADTVQYVLPNALYKFKIRPSRRPRCVARDKIWVKRMPTTMACCQASPTPLQTYRPARVKCAVNARLAICFAGSVHIASGA